jgi:hypothetical protein
VTFPITVVTSPATIRSPGPSKKPGRTLSSNATPIARGLMYAIRC